MKTNFGTTLSRNEMKIFMAEKQLLPYVVALVKA
jgi:hypothetical protein